MSQRHNDFVTIIWLTAITAAVVDLLLCVFFAAPALNLAVFFGVGVGAYGSYDLVYRPTAHVRQKGFLSHVIVIRQRLSVRALLYVLLGGSAALLFGFPIGQLFHSTFLLWAFGLIGAAAGSYCAFCIPELRAPDLFRHR